LLRRRRPGQLIRSGESGHAASRGRGAPAREPENEEARPGKDVEARDLEEVGADLLERSAKGPNLLGVRAVIAESFERINRSNLVGIGILRLVFPRGVSAASLGLTGRELASITGARNGEAREATVTAAPDEGERSSSPPASASIRCGSASTCATSASFQLALRGLADEA
jgi:hypothetical protein